MRKTRIAEKGQSNLRVSPRRFCKLRLMILFMVICLAYSFSSASTSRLYPPSEDEAGGLRLSQVVGIATREEILKLGDSLQHLLASGLKNSDFKDGSLAMGRIYCCHPSTEEGTAIWFYVPPDVTVNRGDLVIIRMGRKSTKGDPGTVNLAIEVREKKDAPNSQCSWDPPNDAMWTRVLYCSWMPAEDWTLKNGLHKTWLKRPADAKAQ